MFKKPVKKRRVKVKLVLMLFMYFAALFSFRSIRITEPQALSTKDDIEYKDLSDESLNQHIDLTYDQQVTADKYYLSAVHIGLFSPSLAFQIYQQKEVIKP